MATGQHPGRSLLWPDRRPSRRPAHPGGHTDAGEQPGRRHCQYHAAHERLVLINAWVVAPTWPESRGFLAEHQDRLAAAGIRQTRRALDDDIARQHLAILDLVAATTIDAGYAVVTDAGTAEER
jgi:hypothetical protein